MDNTASGEAQLGSINPALLHTVYDSKLFYDLWCAARSKVHNSPSAGDVYEYLVIKVVALTDVNNIFILSDAEMPRELSISRLEILSTLEDCHDANEFAMIEKHRLKESLAARSIHSNTAYVLNDGQMVFKTKFHTNHSYIVGVQKRLTSAPQKNGQSNIVKNSCAAQPKYPSKRNFGI